MARKRKPASPIEEHASAEEATPAWQLHDWTIQEAAFASSMLRHGNPTRAYGEAFSDDLQAMPAGYRLVTCENKGWKLARTAWLRSYLDDKRDQLKDQLAVTKENITRELARIGFANMADLVSINGNGDPSLDLSGLTRDQAAAIQEFTVEHYTEGRGDDGRTFKQAKLKLAPKTPALELAGKTLKMFTDVVEHQDLNDIAETMMQRRRERAKRRKDASRAAEPGEDDNASD